MSDALFATTQALKARIEAVTGANTVHVGAPPADVADGSIALILFDIQPNAALRNVPRFAAPPTSGPVLGSAARLQSIALDLRYLIFCLRADSNSFGADPVELKQLGRIVAALHADPVLDATPAANDSPQPNPPPAVYEQQIVRVSLESYGLDEWNRLWALFPELTFRTSLAYLATPVHVTAGEEPLYPRIQAREHRAGVLADAPADQAA